MDDLNRSIIREIQSGRYYINARKWYANKFIYVIAERSYLAIITSAFIIALCILGFFYMEINPLSQQSSYLISLPDITKQYAVVKAIGDAERSPQMNINKYMLGQYVIQRESYTFKKITAELAGNNEFIKKTSSNEEYLKYKNYISINNPYSPVLLYRTNNKVDIRITKTMLLKQEINATYNKATIYYDSILTSFITGKVTTTKMAVDINYQIEDINKAIDKRKLNFLVLSYYIYKIMKN